MKHILLSVLFICILFVLSGQNMSMYSKIHKDYLAKQSTINNSILFKENRVLPYYLQETNDRDINYDYWQSDKVNPYNENEVPFEYKITLGTYSMPCENADVINSSYGYRKKFGRMHKGIDLKASTGDTIYAVFDGKVRLTKYERGGFGFYIIVRHYNSTETVYAHLSRFLVKPDQYVKSGDAIGLAGNSGRSTGPHLHFEIRYMGYAINPEGVFDFNNKVTKKDHYTFKKSTYQKKQS